MSIRLGVIEYDRPSKPINADNIRQILSVAGKDVIRLAWSSLNPSASNYIKSDPLAVWFCEFFNLTRNDGQGSKCIRILCNMDLLHKDMYGGVTPQFDL